MSVVELPGRHTVNMKRDPRSLDVPIEAVLAGAVEFQEELRAVVVCGLDKKGDVYAASSSNSVADVILLLERIKQKLLKQYSEDSFA